MVTAFLLWAMLPKVEPDVVFAKVGETELKMDLYYPSESAPKTNAAVVVIHGGGLDLRRQKADGTPRAALCLKGAVCCFGAVSTCPKAQVARDVGRRAVGRTLPEG